MSGLLFYKRYWQTLRCCPEHLVRSQAVQMHTSQYFCTHVTIPNWHFRIIKKQKESLRQEARTIETVYTYRHRWAAPLIFLMAVWRAEWVRSPILLVKLPVTIDTMLNFAVSVTVTGLERVKHTVSVLGKRSQSKRRITCSLHMVRHNCISGSDFLTGGIAANTKVLEVV